MLPPEYNPPAPATTSSSFSVGVTLPVERGDAPSTCPFCSSKGPLVAAPLNAATHRPGVEPFAVNVCPLPTVGAAT
jgi:hypothetical protein